MHGTLSLRDYVHFYENIPRWLEEQVVLLPSTTAKRFSLWLRSDHFAGHHASSGITWYVKAGINTFGSVSKCEYLLCLTLRVSVCVCGAKERLLPAEHYERKVLEELFFLDIVFFPVATDMTGYLIYSTDQCGTEVKT